MINKIKQKFLLDGALLHLYTLEDLKWNHKFNFNIFKINTSIL